MKDFNKFKELLESEYIWPAPYTFKFLIKEQQLELLKETVTMDNIQIKASQKGKYLSVSYTKIILQTDHIIEIYQLAQKIEGIICL